MQRSTPAGESRSASAVAIPPATEARPWEYSAFPVRIAHKVRLTPGFVRLTLAGPELRHFAAWGLDQRIKLVLPMPDGSAPEFGLLDEPTPHPKEWYTRWKELPEARRNVLRTYTPAAIRPDLGEIDVDLFIHEPAGPASAWALACAPGDELVITGPDARVGYTGYGIHYEPPAGAVAPRQVLLIGDESALPAIRNIVRQLPVETLAQVLLELGDARDNTLATARVPVAASASASASASVSANIGAATPHVTVVVRDQASSALGTDGLAPGELLRAAVREWGAARDTSLDAETYAWVAGESAATIAIRRYLTREVGLAKERVSFLGYWKLGGPLVG